MRSALVCGAGGIIGPDETVTINELAKRISDVACKEVSVRSIPGPIGGRGRSSDNRLVEAKRGWRPRRPLSDGLRQTHEWIANQLEART